MIVLNKKFAKGFKHLVISERESKGTQCNYESADIEDSI